MNIFVAIYEITYRRYGGGFICIANHSVGQWEDLANRLTDGDSPAQVLAGVIASLPWLIIMDGDTEVEAMTSCRKLIEWMEQDAQEDVFDKHVDAENTVSAIWQRCRKAGYMFAEVEKGLAEINALDAEFQASPEYQKKLLDFRRSL